MQAEKFMNKIELVLAVFLCVSAHVCLGSDFNPQPQNKVVVMIDGSGSYKSRQEEAVQKTISLLDSMAATKLHRWESASDRITLISLDAMPEVLWEGTLRDLKGLDRAAWKSRFLARSDYDGCTDVVSAFGLAAKKIEGDARYVSKYVFAFTDLIHQPPTDSLSRPREATNLIPEDFPWQSFKDVSVSVFWVPPDQKLIWRKAADRKGLGSNFALYTTSESSSVNISLPPRPVLKVTEAEQEADRKRFTEMGKVIFKALIGFFTVGVILVALAVLAGYFRRNRRQPGLGPHPVSNRPVNAQRPTGTTASNPDFRH